jgi:hypothetical protein
VGGTVQDYVHNIKKKKSKEIIQGSIHSPIL